MLTKPTKKAFVAFFDVLQGTGTANEAVYTGRHVDITLKLWAMSYGTSMYVVKTYLRFGDLSQWSSCRPMDLYSSAL